MPKRFEDWSAAEIHITPEHQAAILEKLPLSDAEDADAAVAEIEKILGLLKTNRTRLPELREATDQLVALSKAAMEMHRALEDLGKAARMVMSGNFGIADMDPVSDGPYAISGLMHQYSTWAKEGADEFRPGKGRRTAWHERFAVMQLADFWERRTGKKASWANAKDDGGPFALFVFAVSDSIGERSIRAALRDRGRNSAD